MENPEPVQGAVLATYRALRLSMVVLVVFHAAAIVLARLSATCMQSTISDYYYTSAHAVFIGALSAVGACLIIYQGSSNTEDMLLNFSGLLAFVIALVPTARPHLCGPGLPDGYVAPVRENVKALLVAAVLALAIYLPVKGRSMVHEPTAPQAQSAGHCAVYSYWIQRLVPWLLAAVLLAGLAYFAGYRRQFAQHAHRWAAAGMFFAIILVVVINAFHSWRRTDRSRMGKFWVTAAYSVIAGLMFVFLVAAIFVYAKYGPEWKQWGVFALESALIGLFVAFWVVQTIDMWNISDYRCVLPPRPDVALR